MRAEAGGSPADPVFRVMRGSHTGKALSTQSVGRILLDAIADAGEDPSGFSPHFLALRSQRKHVREP